MLTGLLLLVVTALLWVMQGSVVSNAAEKKLNISFIQMMMGLVVMICILPLKFFVEIAVFLCYTFPHETFAQRILYLFCAYISISFSILFLNFQGEIK